MRSLIAFSVICALVAFTTIACERNGGVRASNDEYKPRPAPKPTEKNEAKGELLRVDLAGTTLSIRLANGLEQTFNIDDQTVITSGDQHHHPYSLRDLMGKDGSELTVRWHDGAEIKTASNIEVTQFSTSRRHRRERNR